MAELIFGKYEITSRLASGGMGEVFLAQQHDLSARRVILKSLLPELAAQPAFIAQFLDEARVVGSLNHPHVVSVYEVGAWHGTYYMAMEYIDGLTLAAVQRRCLEDQLRLPPRVAAAIVRDASLGLAHAHAAVDVNGAPLHIVHRDVSPQNVMVRHDGVAKVVDFGIAWMNDRQTRTATGVVKGKLAYMSPEQALGRPVAASSDQFSLGVVLWELLTGKRLFKAVGDLEVLKRVLDEPIVSPSLVKSDVPTELDHIVMKMLHRSPERRFATCSEVAAALDGMSEGRTPTGESQVARFLQSLAGGPAPAATAAPKDFVVQLSAAPLAAPDAPARILPALPRPGARGPELNRLAIASVALSLLYCVPLASLAAIVVGVRARQAIASSGGRESGALLATVGIALGGLGTAVMFGLLYFLLRH